MDSELEPTGAVEATATKGRVSSAQATLSAIRGQLQHVKAFSEAHHADEPSGSHLHALLVDIPCYLALAIDQITRELDKG